MSKSQFSPAHAVMVHVLIEARRDKRMTQTELADALGKPQSFVAKIEGRERRVDVLEFCAIAKALGIDPVTLFAAVTAALPDDLAI